MRAYALLGWFFGHFQSRACMYGEDRILNGGSIVFTSFFDNFKVHNPDMQGRIWLVFERNQALINI